MQSMLKSYILIVFVFFSKINFAQEVFYFDPAIATSITAATYDHSKKAVMFFSGNNFFYYPIGSQNIITPEWYNFEAIKSVDAALDWDDDNSLFFTGSSYRMFKHSTGEFVTADTKWPNLPTTWNNKIDGAVKWENGIIFFFYKKEYLIYDMAANSIVDQNDITQWQGWPPTWGNGIDDAFNVGDGYIYFMRQGEVMPYSIKDKTFFNPKQITVTQTNGQQIKAFKPVASPPTNVNIESKMPPSTTYNNQTNGQQQGDADLTSSICITGVPSGSGLREIQSPIEGDQQGRLYYDNLPKGYRISEIKIYTSKVWGKTVICGLQTVLQSSQKQRVEQIVLGKKSLNENNFVLEEDECITGISGTKNGESGNYIYSLQIITSVRTSPLYGERGTEKGRETFTLGISEPGIFNGFTGNFNNNMTGIGIKYYGQTNAVVKTPQYSPETNTNTATNFENTNAQNNQPVYGNQQTVYDPNAAPVTNTKVELVDEYLDNYEDFIQGAGSSNLWSKGPMPGLDWLGVGFDILRFDPLFPNETKNRKTFKAIVLTNSSERGGTEAQYVLPYGTLFGSINSGNNIDTSGWISNYREYASSFNISASGKVGIPGLASGSLSGSFEETSNASLGSKVIYHFQKTVKKIHELNLELYWRDQNTGQKYKQRIHPSFKDAVTVLPVITGTVPVLSVYDMKRNQPLSSSLELIKNKYYDLISKYGTHFTNHVAWGGQYVIRNIAKQSDFESSKTSKTEWKNNAEITIKKVNIEREMGGGNSQTDKNNSSVQKFKQQIFVQGGKGETDQNKWEDKVDLSPAPIEMSFTSTADILCKELFPLDKDIEKKSLLLKLFTEKYLVDNMREPVVSKDDFFNMTVLPTQGNISIRNGGGYVMKFTVTFDQNGQMQTRTTSSFPIGKTENIAIPAEATNIKLKAELYTGWLSDTKVIFEKTYATPELKCYKVWGTVFNATYGECDQ